MPVPIPNVGRNQLAEWGAELGFTRIVEVGVRAGEYTEILCRANPQARIYGIDPWATYAGYMDGSRYNTQRWNNEQYRKARSIAASFPNCSLIRKYSMAAVKEFERDSIDMVYIDGNHDFAHCTEDIQEWTKIVRPGGIIAGHDYKPMRLPHEVIEVYQAVNAYTAAHSISPWFVLGARQSHPGVIRDKYRSWMWVKK